MNLVSLTVDELFAIARRKSVQGRVHLAEVVTDLFLDEGALSDVERAMMFDILQSLVRDMEVPLRRKIARHLADVDDAPRDLFIAFANDEIEIAYPILLKSNLLEDHELIEIVHHRTLEHSLTISTRETVSESVSEALVATGEERVIKSLLENKNARLSRQVLEFLVEESKRVNSFQEPLVNRSDLPEDLAKRLWLWVSAALRTHIVEKYEIDAAELDRLMEAATRETLSDLAHWDEERPDRKKELIDTLEQQGRLTPDLLIALLEDGLVSLFVSVFARMASLTETLSRRLIYEQGGEGLAIACRAIGMIEADFIRLFALTRRSRAMSRKMLKREVRLMTELFHRIGLDGAGKVLRRWQQGADYLSAVRDVTGVSDAVD